MGLTVGTDSRGPLPIYYKFLYGGTEVSWGQPTRINDFQNSGESIDGKYRISDIDVSFYDVNGSYFTNSFGKGTNGFGTSLQVVAYLGGTMEYAGQGPYGTVWKRIGTAGAYTATMHTGKVYGISFSNQQLRVRSKNNLALIGDMKWQYPLTKYPLDFSSPDSSNAYMLGSYAFGVSGVISFSKTYASAFFNFEDGGNRFQTYGYVLSTYYSPNINAVYPLINGRGTGDISSASPNVLYTYAGTDSGGTNFYDVNNMILLHGSRLGTYTGTIQTDDVASEYGYRNVQDAENHKTSGSVYNIDKDRLKITGSFTGQYIHLIEPIRISGSPKDCYQTCMTGAMVTPFFGTSDLDPTTLNQAGTLTAFSYYTQTIYPNENGKAFDEIKQIVESTRGLFSVDTNNRFQYRPYGPKDLRTSTPSLGTSDIISSEFTNFEDDYYNRFILMYAYDPITKHFNSQLESKTHLWNSANDKLLKIESKWIQNPNEAGALVNRLRIRYENTVPRVSFSTPINKAGIEIGDLYQITDPNSLLNSKLIQIIGYTKGWTDKTIQFDALDAESVYSRKGFSFWGTTGTLPGDTVSNSSRSGWGTGGTQANINQSIYGSQFSWW
jgi:hypothetical protein